VPHSAIYLAASLGFIAFWLGTYNRALYAPDAKWLWLRTVVVGFYHAATFWDEAHFAFFSELVAQFMCWSHWIGFAESFTNNRRLYFKTK